MSCFYSALTDIGLGETMEELFKTMQDHFETAKNARLNHRKALLDEYHQLCQQVIDLTKEAEEMRAHCRTLHITVEPSSSVANGTTQVMQ